MLKYPFEAPFDEIRENPDLFVSSVFSSLESEFLLMPKGAGFVEYAVFERGYEALKAETKAFSELEPNSHSSDRGSTSEVLPGSPRPRRSIPPFGEDRLTIKERMNMRLQCECLMPP
jgi:hypothetical protein